MPKLFGLNLVAVLAAAVAFFVIGWVWYGVVFMETWTAEMGIAGTEPEQNPVYLVGGFIITLLTVIGIGSVMKWKNATALSAAAVTGLILWALFALPFSAYGYLYSPAHSTTLFMIDAGHLLVGWVVSAGVLSLLKV